MKGPFWTSIKRVSSEGDYTTAKFAPLPSSASPCCTCKTSQLFSPLPYLDQNSKSELVPFTALKTLSAHLVTSGWFDTQHSCSRLISTSQVSQVNNYDLLQSWVQTLHAHSKIRMSGMAIIHVKLLGLPQALPLLWRLPYPFLQLLWLLSCST